MLLLLLLLLLLQAAAAGGCKHGAVLATSELPCELPWLNFNTFLKRVGGAAHHSVSSVVRMADARCWRMGQSQPLRRAASHCLLYTAQHDLGA